MKREWKPGEVAMVNDCTNPDAPWKPATCKEAARPGQCETVWILHDTGAKVWGSVSEARPLVVIDPEDREAVERLLTLSKWPGEVPQYVIDDMQTALREYANPKPPKPEEPTGLGAVVEDEDGERWVRATNYTTVNHWRGCDNSWQGRRKWDDIDPARVLSEGVQP